jgi:hypothetical protein
VRQTGEHAVPVSSLRRHVLTPLSEAQSIVQQEKEEIEVEKVAFQHFKQRVSDFATVSPPTVD